MEKYETEGDYSNEIGNELHQIAFHERGDCVNIGALRGKRGSRLPPAVISLATPAAARMAPD
ncbi:hypothetical protein RSSM_03064 [Rhodopirellula sallentina SM41]|uniref:Uncharacterized protein n=1 Tax=Rhodopirellula sallentina SM41 TaxID=1263870 RepID=M5U238_9BACT|nr:hypothetical protein RSSM_03064 [Rhodopirellula sallentina SM41]